MAKWVLIGFISVFLSACGDSSDSNFEVTDLNPGCDATTIIWTDSDDLAVCEAVMDAGEADEQALLLDIDLPVVGSVELECVDENWVVQDASEQCAMAPAGLRQVIVSLSADGTSRWYEYFSDAFAQIDKGWNGSDVLDGFYLIGQLPDFVQVGGGYDQFPSEGDWVDILNLTYDVDGLLGIGEELAPIIALVAEFNDVIPGEGSVLARPYATEFSNINGTVALRDGEIVGIAELRATVTFIFDTPGGILPWITGDTLEATGDLIVEGNGRFSLYAATPAPLIIGDADAVWDLTGQVNPDSFE
jgi:hypothetical protein